MNLNNENSNLRNQLKRQDKDINNLESKLTISEENLFNAQNKIKGLELGSNMVNELNYELKLAYKDLNNLKEIERK